MITEKEIKELYESSDKVVKDRYGISFYKFPKNTLTPCADYCPFRDLDKGCIGIVKAPEGYDQDLIYYCQKIRCFGIANNYSNFYLIPIDIPEKLFYRKP